MLLILQKICNQKNVKLPWDEVGAQLGGTITGGAIVQHLAKLRAKRVDRGLPVPEPLKRGSGGSVAFSTDAMKGSGGARKGRQGKRPAALFFNTSNEDDDEEYDVDKASDTEASFGEVRKKKVKREIEDGIDKDDYGTMTKPKGGQPNKNSKAAKRIQTDFFEATKQILKKESSPEASTVTITGRAGRRTSVNYAKIHNGGSEYDTEDEMNEPHVAAGSSFLKLEGVSPIGNKEESVTDHDEGENSENDEEVAEYEGEVSRDASASLEQQDDDDNTITVLHLGKSERSLAFLKALHSSYTSTAPLGYGTSAVVENVGPLPASSGRRGSTDFDTSGVRGTMTSDNLNHQAYSNVNSLNTDSEYHSLYHTSPYANAFQAVYSSAPNSSAMPQYGSAMPQLMSGFSHPIPVRDTWGNDVYPGQYGQYPNKYGFTPTYQSLFARQPPVNSNGSPGPLVYNPGGVFNDMLPLESPSNALLSSVPQSPMLRSDDFSSLSNTRNNSMSTSATANGQQNIQNYAQNNSQAMEMNFNNGEKLTSIYSPPSLEQHDPVLAFNMWLNNDLLRGGSSFDPFLSKPNGDDL